jgi:ligand-binding SRPBCC domain-containing protein
LSVLACSLLSSFPPGSLLLGALALHLDRELWVPRPFPGVSAFFQLPRIWSGSLQAGCALSWLHFEPSPLPIEMQAGALIDYRNWLYRVPIRWRTLIRTWELPLRFGDEQLSGPYAVWRHEHIFAEHNGGTMISDHVRYRAPRSFLSDPLMVRR